MKKKGYFFNIHVLFVCLFHFICFFFSELFFRFYFVIFIRRCHSCFYGLTCFGSVFRSVPETRFNLCLFRYFVQRSRLRLQVVPSAQIPSQSPLPERSARRELRPEGRSIGARLSRTGLVPHYWSPVAGTGHRPWLERPRNLGVLSSPRTLVNRNGGSERVWGLAEGHLRSPVSQGPCVSAPRA